MFTERGKSEKIELKWILLIIKRLQIQCEYEFIAVLDNRTSSKLIIRHFIHVVVQLYRHLSKVSAERVHELQKIKAANILIYQPLWAIKIINQST